MHHHKQIDLEDHPTPAWATAAIVAALVAPIIPLILLMAAAVLWIETGSPWAGPTTISVMALGVAAAWIYCIKRS
ncbi:hypothetical protein [Actinomadura litoris]|uniref:Uncharacterized protein n=1 Tax=Actinomadura litoris TaxID=2678616 RepID=A0A7K1LAD2_9ACTN|nr:hypothetical protein [Actinomadura litoris]MUN41382.1 hypothetical protein [Actinomadura litoris]